MSDVINFEEKKDTIDEAPKKVVTMEDEMRSVINFEEKKDATGEAPKKVVTMDDVDSLEPITETFEEYMARHNDDKPINIDSLAAVAALHEQFPNLGSEDIDVLAKVAVDWSQEKYTNAQDAFDALTDNCQDAIADSMRSAGITRETLRSNKVSYDKVLSMYIASFFDMLVNDARIDVINRSARTEIDKIYNEYGSDILNIYAGSFFYKLNKVNEAIQKAEDRGDKEALERVSAIKEYFESSYTLEIMADAVKHIKIKKRMIDDPSKTLEVFNDKYKEHKRNITSIDSIIPIIEKYCSVTHEQAVDFTLCFARFCLNMSPDNANEHLFMYYVINNLVMTAMVQSEQTEFGKALIENVSKIIDIRSKKSDTYEPTKVSKEVIDEYVARFLDTAKKKENVEEADAEATEETIEE